MFSGIILLVRKLELDNNAQMTNLPFNRGPLYPTEQHHPIISCYRGGGGGGGDSDWRSSSQTVHVMQSPTFGLW